MSIKEQLKEIENNIANITEDYLLFEMNRRYRELKKELKYELQQEY